MFIGNLFEKSSIKAIRDPLKAMMMTDPWQDSNKHILDVTTWNQYPTNPYDRSVKRDLTRCDELRKKIEDYQASQQKKTE